MANKKELLGFSQKFREDLRKEAQAMMAADMPQPTEELFALFEQTGNRLKYEKVYFTRRKMLAILGLEAIARKLESGQDAVGESTAEETAAAGKENAAGEAAGEKKASCHACTVESKNAASEENIALYEKLEAVIQDICAEECWALPAHVNRKEADWRITVDLFASETAQTLSEICDRLGDVLGEDTKKQVKEQVEKRIFTPFFGHTVPYPHWEHCDNNWNAVCSGSIGSACLHLLKGPEERNRLDACLERICNALQNYVKGFTNDGTCIEGLGYFTYGMTYFVKFGMELREYSNGRLDLFRGDWGAFHKGEEDKRGRMALFQEKCYFSDGRTLCFSDGDSHDTFRVGLTCALADIFPKVQIPNMERAAGLCSDTCFRFAALMMDLTEPGKYLEHLEAKTQETAVESRKESSAEEMAADCETKQPNLAGSQNKEAEGAQSHVCHILPDSQWVICESDNRIAMACKGGNNGESHNHNDVGHFLYETEGVLLLTDLGAGEYTRQYFSEERYTILCNNSFSHSVPVLDGKGQKEGAEYKCRAFKAEKTERKAVVEMELAGAYPKGLAESIDRTLEFDLHSGKLSVKDVFVLCEKEGKGTAQENIVTQIKPVVEGNQIILEENGVKGVLTVVEPVAPKFLVEEYDHSNHSGNPEKVYTIRWEVTGAESCFTMEKQ